MDPGRSDYRFDWRMSLAHAQTTTYQEDRPQDMRMLPFPAERMYKCGSCSSMYHMVWQLHEHVLLHTADGLYIYNHTIKTAFPKLSGVSKEIQTDMFEDVSAIKNVEVVSNTTQTEDSLCYYFSGRGEEPSESVELGVDDFNANVEVKIEKVENEICDTSVKSENDDFDGSVDPYGDETDEDISFLSVENSSIDVNNHECNTKTSPRTSKKLKNKFNQNDKKERPGRKKSKAVKVVYKSKSKRGSIVMKKTLIKCKYCDELFQNNLHMKRHCLRDHPTEKNFPCKDCDQSFVTEAEVQIHRREHNKEKYRCEICDKVLASAQSLQDHITVHTGQKLFECMDCGNSFRSKRQLNLHARRRHNPNYDHMCENCGKVFKIRQNLQSHIKCCLDIRPFECKICGNRYPRNSYLTVHMRKHTGENPYICHTCGMKFSRSTILTKHMLVHTAERKYTCEVCGQKFKAPTALKDHERIHKQDKRFSCQYCGKGFIKKCNMVTHLRQHTGETPYKCNICGQAYKQNVLLKTHMQSHKTETLPPSHNPPTTDDYEPTNPYTAAQSILWG